MLGCSAELATSDALDNLFVSSLSYGEVELVSQVTPKMLHQSIENLRYASEYSKYGSAEYQERIGLGMTT